MDQSYSESDISLSPSQILERLQVLRQLQLLQRGKLQKQRLEYQESSENSSSLTEIVSHFSTSTSYNTFRSLLETANDSSNEGTPHSKATSVSSKVKEKDLVDGVSILNLSQESEFIVNSPISARSVVSGASKNGNNNSNTNATDVMSMNKKHISLDDMPVLTPKKDFESLIIEKLKGEVNKKVTDVGKSMPAPNVKKPFLRKGEGTSRFGIQKKDLIIQSTKTLPWRKNVQNKNSLSKTLKDVSQEQSNVEKLDIEIHVTDHDKMSLEKLPKVTKKIDEKEINNKSMQHVNSHTSLQSKESNCEHSATILPPNIQLPKEKHPVLSSKGKTWASVLSKEQNDFLSQLKKSDYYKNFASPAKSTVSDASYDENLLKVRGEREIAEQNMFDLLESKVSHESFNLENSFFNRFLRRSQLECSGESTPLVMQQCLARNPNLMTLIPNVHRRRNEDSHTDIETNVECSDCCSETCSVSSGCSCRTVEDNNSTNYEQDQHMHKNKSKPKEKRVSIQSDSRRVGDKSSKDKGAEKKESDIVKEDTEMKANMVEMNAKLIATSELLKERLRELEDEIETFRKENTNLTKMREEIDAERHKFYEEKTMFEQKFNEEKILSEYYIAEEKEKLTKQKQMYEKYVREMRGRLNKKDKDEVINLKKEINDLKEEIRLKDAKSTSTIARLRNQIKLMEKEKKDFTEEIEKLKKENRRIQHSNDITRRMTNMKYLEEINKKLSNMAAKETQSEVNFDSNAKYKVFEIERQSRPRKVQANNNKPIRSRAKSVPNLKVTSRYAKYFSQRDTVSDMEKNKFVQIEPSDRITYSPDNYQSEDELPVDDESDHCSDSEHGDNNLEKLYMERFHSLSPKSARSNLSNSSCKLDSKSLPGGANTRNPDDFFISKSTDKNKSTLSNNVSPISSTSEQNSHRSRVSASVSCHRSSSQRTSRNTYQDHNIEKMNEDQISNCSHGSSISHNNSKSPVSILTNRSSSSHKPTTVIQKDFRDTFNVTPEPPSSRTSTSKTNLNPTEIKKPDGSKELRFPNGNVKFISPDGKYSKFIYYNGDVKENFYSEGRIKYFYAETQTCHTTHADGLEVLEFPDGQVEKRYKDGSSEIRLPNGSIRYFDPKNEHVREEWRFPDGTAITVSAAGEQRIVFSNGQIEVHAKDHKRREFPDGTVKLIYNDGTSETRYASGRVRIKDKHGNLIMDSASR